MRDRHWKSNSWRAGLVVGTVALLLSDSGETWGQPVPSKEGTSTHIFPAGGRRGSTVAVRIGTESMPPGCDLHVWGAGLSASDQLTTEARGGTEPSPRRKPTEIPNSYPREWNARFDIAPDAPPGVAYWRLSCASGGTTARPFVIGDLPEYIETESNSQPERAEAVVLPVTINGRIAGERDVDYFQFRAEPTQLIRCTMLSRRLGSPLDPVIWVYGPSGERIDTAETYEGSDPVLTFRPKISGAHQVRIAHVGGAGGVRFVYRVTLEEVALEAQSSTDDVARKVVPEQTAPSRPEFSLALKSDFFNVTQGDTIAVDVVAVRRGGFSGPIELSIDGLPPGVTCEPATIAGDQATGQLKLSAAVSARLQGMTIDVRGSGNAMGDVLERLATAPHAGVDSEGASAGSPTLEHVLLTVRHKPLFRLFCSEAYQYAHRGTIYPYAMEIERLNGFGNEVVMQLADRQNRDLDGVDMLELRIPPDQSRGDMPIFFPETMHINVQSQTQLYTQGYARFIDAEGRPQAWMAVAEKRNLVRTLPTVARLTAADSTLTSRAGTEIACRLYFQRTANCPGPVSIDLVEPPRHVQLASGKVELPAGATEAIVPIRIAADAGRGDETTLQFRATGQIERGAIVVSEAMMLLRIE